MSSGVRKGSGVIDAVGDLFSEYTSSARRSQSRSPVVKKTTPRHIDSDGFSSAEIDKIHRLWQRAKSELQAKSRELATLKANMSRTSVEARLSNITKEENKALHMELQDKVDKVNMYQQQLEVARRENQRWAHTYDQLSEENEKLKMENKELQRLQQNKEARYKEIEAELRRVESSKDRLISKSIQEIRNTDEDISHKLQTISEQREEISRLMADQSNLRQQRDQYANKMRELEEELEQIRTDCTYTRNALGTARESLNRQQEYLHKNEDFHAQIDHLKIDCGRMFKLLQSTGQFKEFTTLCDDFGDSKGLTYLLDSKHKGVTAKQKSNLKGGMNDISKAQNELQRLDYYKQLYGSGNYGLPPKDGDSERINWAPTEALEFANAFRKQHLSHISMDLIHVFLRQLNDIWQKREGRRMKRLQAKHSRHIKDLKRRLNQNKSYDQVLNTEKVGRLQKSVHAMRHEYLMSSSQLSTGIPAKNSRLEPKAHIDALYVKSHRLLERHNVDVEYGDPAKLLEACLSTLDEVSQKLHQETVANQTLTLALEGHVNNPNKQEFMKQLRAVHLEIERVTQQMIRRVRDCSRRVNSLSQLDKDYPILLMRAFSAMMEDIEMMANELENTSRKQLKQEHTATEEKLNIVDYEEESKTIPEYTFQKKSPKNNVHVKNFTRVMNIEN